MLCPLLPKSLFMTDILSPLKSLWRAMPFAGPQKPLVTLLELNGVIGMSGPGSRRSLNYARVEKAIEAAFKPKSLKAVALSINSPGGSPVQSRLIYRAIRRLAQKRDVPVFAFIEDVGASGGYILAIAADEIYADESSIVGSIGVISSGFGFVDAIDKLGIERRVYTAGTNKSTLDPFKAEKQEDIAHLKTILDETHDQFTSLVRERRGTRLDTEHDDIFTGRFWSAPGAKERGLIDGLSQMTDFLQGRFGEDVEIKKCSPPSPFLLARLTGGGSARLKMQELRNIDTAALIDPDQFLDVIDERSLWAKYGL